MVRAKIEAQEGPWSETWGFELTSGPTTAPTGTPGNVTVTVDGGGQAEMSWDGVPGATEYILVVKRQVRVKKKYSGLKKLIRKILGKDDYKWRWVYQTLYQKTVGDVTFSDLLPGPGKYRIRITPRNGLGIGPFSDWVDFEY
jgi:hypothetical protein